LTGLDWRIYEYIARHFLASISADAIVQKTSGVFEIAGESFSLKGRSPVEEGWTAVMPWLKVAPDRIASDMKEGDLYPIAEVSLTEGKTSPPDNLSESELIGLMEKHGIGTDASIPTHIQNICTRKYVAVDERSRTLQPTPLGISLVHGYRS